MNRHLAVFPKYKVRRRPAFRRWESPGRLSSAAVESPSSERWKKNQQRKRTKIKNNGTEKQTKNELKTKHKEIIQTWQHERKGAYWRCELWSSRASQSWVEKYGLIRSLLPCWTAMNSKPVQWKMNWYEQINVKKLLNESTNRKRSGRWRNA